MILGFDDEHDQPRRQTWRQREKEIQLSKKKKKTKMDREFFEWEIKRRIENIERN